jgi:pimeloyl-ACP methyl ester carboxylesterase
MYHADTSAQRVERDLQLMRRNHATARGYLQQLAAIGRWKLQKQPGRIHSPTLVIHGESDRLVPAENARILADRIFGAKLVLLPNAGHIFPTDQPERTRNELMAFLKP